MESMNRGICVLPENRDRFLGSDKADLDGLMRIGSSVRKDKESLREDAVHWFEA